METKKISTDPKLMSWKNMSFNNRIPEGEPLESWNGDIGFGGSDRRFAYSRQSSFRHFDPRTPILASSDSLQPLLSRSMSSISIPPDAYLPFKNENVWKENDKSSSVKIPLGLGFLSVVRTLRTGSRPMKRLFAMISLNVAYSTAELIIGLFTGRVGLVSDAFHLTFGCGLLTFSLFAMAISRNKPDGVYTYGYKRLEVLAAFTNATAVSFVYVILPSCGSSPCIYTRRI